MKFLIYRQSKSAMQSGKRNAKKWLLVPVESQNSRNINNLMNWVSSKNTVSQLKFQFQSKEEAVTFAKKSGFEFELIEPNQAKIQPKSYASNFTG